MSSELSIIEIENLGFRWKPGDRLLLEIASLEVQRGERVFLSGPSGSGKSTLLSLLAGVNRADTGVVKILGHDLAAISGAARDRFRSDHIGFIFQMFNLIPYLTVIENVTLPCRFSSVRKQKVLAMAGSLEQEAIRLLEHLDLAQKDLVEKPVSELSVGQQQRVAAARALIGAPELVIADEPTSALDTERRAAFIKLLFQECESAGSSLVFVSHDRSLEQPFDRRIRLAELNRGVAA